MPRVSIPAEVSDGTSGIALSCTAEQRSELMALARSRTEEARLVERAKIVLACLEGKRNDAVSREFGVRPNAVGRWRKRFAAAGLAGLRDRARPGKTAKYGADLRLRVLRHLELPPPTGVGQLGWGFSGRSAETAIDGLSGSGNEEPTTG